MILLLFLRILSKQTSLTLKRKAIECFTNLCSELYLEDEYRKVEPALPVLASLLNNEDEDEEVLAEACTVLSSFSDAPNRKIQKIMKSNFCPRLVELLKHRSMKVVEKAVYYVGILFYDEAYSQIILDYNVLECLLKLLSSTDESIRNEVCSSIGILAGNETKFQVNEFFFVLFRFGCLFFG